MSRMYGRSDARVPAGNQPASVLASRGGAELASKLARIRQRYVEVLSEVKTSSRNESVDRRKSG